jgi:hypothetical protein
MRATCVPYAAQVVVGKAGRTGRVFGSARAFLGSARVGLGPRREWTESSPVFRPAASFWLGKLGSVQPESSLFVFFSRNQRGRRGILGWFLAREKIQRGLRASLLPIEIEVQPHAPPPVMPHAPPPLMPHAPPSLMPHAPPPVMPHAPCRHRRRRPEISPLCSPSRCRWPWRG